jgi:leader peptidase (prepilin peptidase)/N-methyltransferase
MLETSLVDRWVGAVVCGLALAAIAEFYRRMRSKDGMGGGDPKLVAAIGAWIGWQALPLMLLLASLGGILWALIAQRKGDQPLVERRVPFGVFACTAAFATVPLWPLLSAR